jgi:AcrR family transcriptional regulator
MGKSHTKTTYHHKSLRQALIDTALEMVAEKRDMNTLSLREIARRIGVSQSAPYRHFADKDALLASVAEEGFNLLLAYLHNNTDKRSDDPLHELQTSGVAYVKFAILHPSHYRVMFNAFRANDLSYPALNTVEKDAFAVMVDAISSGQAAGKIKAGDPLNLACITWSLTHGLAMLLIDRQLPITEEGDVMSLAELATQSLIHGIYNEGDKTSLG